MKHQLISIITLSASLALFGLSSGCQSASSGASREILAQAAVVYATAKVIENNPTYAERIAQIAAEVRGVAAGDTAATVDTLIALARSRVDWSKLSPADVALVNLLLDAVKAELVARLGTLPLPQERALQVAKVAGWIEDAAKAYRP